MKTRNIISAIALIVFASASLMASDPEPAFEIKNVEGSSIYKVVYKSAGEGKASMKIFDKDHRVLYSEVLNYTHGFTYPLDFAGMTEGEYTIEISDKENQLRQSLVYDVKSPLAYVHVSKQPNE